MKQKSYSFLVTVKAETVVEAFHIEKVLEDGGFEVKVASLGDIDLIENGEDDDD